jgi:hypothetical protein
MTSCEELGVQRQCKDRTYLVRDLPVGADLGHQLQLASVAILGAHALDELFWLARDAATRGN